MNITANEKLILDAIDRWGGNIWSECLQDEVPSIAPTSIPGVVSSLVKKGLIESHGQGRDAWVEMTEAGDTAHGH